MGLKSSCTFVQTFSSALELVASRQLHLPHILHMLDGVMIISPSDESCGLQLHSVISLCGRIGIPMSKEKTFQPSTTLTFLGMELDTLAFETRLDKLTKCPALIDGAFTKKKAALKESQ